MIIFYNNESILRATMQYNINRTPMRLTAYIDDKKDKSYDSEDEYPGFHYQDTDTSTTTVIERSIVAIDTSQKHEIKNEIAKYIDRINIINDDIDYYNMVIERSEHLCDIETVIGTKKKLDKSLKDLAKAEKSLMSLGYIAVDDHDGDNYDEEI